MKWLSSILMIPVFVTVLLISGFITYMNYIEYEKEAISKHRWYADRVTQVSFSTKQIAYRGDIKVKSSIGDFYAVGQTFIGHWKLQNNSMKTVVIHTDRHLISISFSDWVVYSIKPDKVIIKPGQEAIIQVIGYIDPEVLDYKNSHLYLDPTPYKKRKANKRPRTPIARSFTITLMIYDYDNPPDPNDPMHQSWASPK
jgi:hypothetical protein